MFKAQVYVLPLLTYYNAALLFITLARKFWKFPISEKNQWAFLMFLSTYLQSWLPIFPITTNLKKIKLQILPKGTKLTLEKH